LGFETLEPRLALAANFVISEFLADNSRTLVDNFGVASDWVEIHNSGDAAGSLAGYYLTDNAGVPTKWQFPNVSLAAGGYLVVFASGRDLRDPAQPLHANFALSKDGEYLALVKPDGVTRASEYAPQFPPQRTDISQGLGQIVDTVNYVLPGSAAQTLVPNAATDPNAWKQPGFNATGWITGAVGVGYGQTVGGFLVKTYQANTAAGSPMGTTLDSIDEVLNLVGNPAAYTSVAAGNYPTINFRNNYSGAGNAARYTTGQVEFPGQSSGTDYNHVATEIHAQITIPAAGAWTFGLDHNEGYLLQIGDFEAIQNGTGSTEQFHTFTFAAPGSYELDLFHFERTGSSYLKLYAAQGTFTSFNSSAFRLVGDVAGGGLAVTSHLVSPDGRTIAESVNTNIKSQLFGVNSSWYTRLPFNVANPAAFDQLKLRVKYDDAFVAYLNGTEIARRNFNGTPMWNSVAASARTGHDVLNYVDIDVTPFLSSLVSGANVLAIQGINASAADLDALLVPELIAIDIQTVGQAFFTTPTPGAANGTGVQGFVAEPTYSVERGFYNAPFQVTITAATPQSQIYYTTNGSAPTQATGILYTGPINVTGTTALRAAAFRSGYLPSASVSTTYLFLNDIVRQTPATTLAAGFPATWGSLTTDYGLDPDVIGTFDASGNPLGGDLFGGQYAATIKNDLLSIPTISIVMDVNDMFGPSGIYTNSTQRSSLWERAASFEWINPNGTLKFQANAGIRIQGGAFRSDNLTKKHSLRLLFKNEYGPGKLSYPIFGDGDDVADEFNTIVLRAGANDGYTWNSARYTEQYIRDQFGRSLQAAAGHTAAHGTFAHLYINGVYWGLYNPVERPDNEFAASYLGGDPDNWDSIHVDETPAGDSAAWDAMLALAAQGATSTAAYMQLQGRNADGTPNPAVPPLIDLENYLDYIAINAWGGNWDWPNKNYWAGRDRDPATTDGFQFFMWDFENTMGNNRSRSPLNATTFDDIAKFTGARSVGQVHTSLKNNAEYRLAFADRVHKLFFNDGILTPANLIARYAAIAAGVERAIVAESARWGDSHFSTAPLTLADWKTERDWILNTYLPQRSALVLQEMKDYGLYPTVVAPTFSKHGGQVTPGFQVTVAAPAGTIWYTLDGRDPRLVGGAVAPTAVSVPSGGTIAIPAGLTLKARVLSGGVWSAVNEAAFTTAVPADATNLRISELNYNPAPLAGVVDEQDLEFIELVNPSAQTVSLDGVQITQFSSTPYAFPNGLTLAPGERIVVARNPAVFTAAYGGGIRLALAGYGTQNLSNGGEAIGLVGPAGQTLVSFTYDDDTPWPTAADGNGKSLEIIDPLGNPANPANWRASYYRGGSPGTAGTAPLYAGDFDGDNDVDGADFLAWQRGVGTPALRGTAVLGDANGDRVVDRADFLLWRTSHGSHLAEAADAPALAAAVGLANDQWFVLDAPIAVHTPAETARQRALDAVLECVPATPLAPPDIFVPRNKLFHARPLSPRAVDAAVADSGTTQEFEPHADSLSKIGRFSRSPGKSRLA
jgi:hypothetical protein